MFITVTTSSLRWSVVSRVVALPTYSLATAIHLPSGLRATSRMGNVALSRISSNLLPSSVYLLTVPSSEPVMKKPFYSHVRTTPLSMHCCTYSSHDCRIILLTVVDCDWFIVGPSAEDAAIVVDSGCNELLSIRRVGKVCCARGVCKFKSVSTVAPLQYVDLALTSLSALHSSHNVSVDGRVRVCANLLGRVDALSDPLAPHLAWLPHIITIPPVFSMQTTSILIQAHPAR